VLNTKSRWRPPAPVPHVKPLKLLALLKTLSSNPLEAWTQAHFDEPIVKTSLAFGEVAVVSSPAAIRHVLVDNVSNYRKDSLQRRMLSSLSNGILTAEGDEWAAQRRMFAPIFTARTVKSFAPAMMEAVDALCERWSDSEDQVIDVSVEVTRLTLDVLERTIFSDGLGRNAEEVRTAMRTFFDTVGRIDPFDVLGLPAFVPRLGRLSARPALRLLDNAIDKIIASRHRRLAKNAAGVPRDILTLLLEAQDPETGRGVSEAEVRANILTFMSAGHESTSNAITWTLFLLSQSDEWRERVIAEVEREMQGPVDTLAKRLIQTRAVIDEAIRLYPPLAAISRVAIGPDELAGVRIKQGTIIVIAPYVLHRHQRLWKDSDLFDPNRFLSPAREQIDRFAYLPFGGGLRGCLGSIFALQEATLAIAAIMKNFELWLAPGQEVWPLHRITLRPRGGLHMTVRNRNPVSSKATAAIEVAYTP
jgi:cytochrome P450